MTEGLAICVLLAAGIRLVKTAAEGLLATIKLMKVLVKVPEKLALLLKRGQRLDNSPVPQLQCGLKVLPQPGPCPGRASVSMR